MNIQEVYDFVVAASGVTNLHTARTRFTGDMFINAKVLASTPQGERGYWGIGGVRRLQTNVTIMITDKSQANEQRPYYDAQKRAFEIADRIAATTRAEGIVDFWVDDFVFETPDEPGEDFVVQVGIPVMVEHEA